MTNSVLSQNMQPHDHGIVIGQHSLPETSLFHDKALAQAIEDHPSENLDICVQGSFETCNRNGFSGAQLIEAVKQGKFWLNLRHIEEVDSEIGRLVKTMHAEAESALGRKAHSKIGGLLISSPSATVGYHFDLTDVTLWHIRGRKKIYIYPKAAPYLENESIQDIALAEGVEKIPYDSAFDAAAKSYELAPGQMIAWRHLSPHRVDNVAALNVSLSLESMSLSSRLTVGAHFCDGFLRKRLGLKVFAHSENKALQFIKTGLAIVIKKTGLTRSNHMPTVYKYNLDLNAPNFLSDIIPAAAE